MLTEPIAAGSVLFVPRATLVCWMALLLLLSCDRRRSTALPATLLALCACVASLYTLFADAEGWAGPRGWWFASALLSALQVVVQLRRWTRISPIESHAQAKQVDAPAASSQGQDSRRRIKFLRLRSTNAPSAGLGTHALQGPARLALASGCAGVAVTACALSQSWLEGSAADTTLRCAVIMHQIAAALLGALAIVAALETTYLSTPDALKPSMGPHVAWKWLAAVGALALCLELVLCGSIIFQLDVESSDGATVALSVVFMLALLVVAFVTWMVPHRIYRFQQQGGARGWASLTVATWLAVLTLVLVLALPSTWPWKLLLE